jgi:hypothetical protein
MKKYLLTIVFLLFGFLMIAQNEQVAQFNNGDKIKYQILKNGIDNMKVRVSLLSFFSNLLNLNLNYFNKDYMVGTSIGYRALTPYPNLSINGSYFFFTKDDEKIKNVTLQKKQTMYSANTLYRVKEKLIISTKLGIHGGVEMSKQGVNSTALFAGLTLLKGSFIRFSKITDSRVIFSNFFHYFILNADVKYYTAVQQLKENPAANNYSGGSSLNSFNNTISVDNRSKLYYRFSFGLMVKSSVCFLIGIESLPYKNMNPMPFFSLGTAF